jgi:hypothetical protein
MVIKRQCLHFFGVGDFGEENCYGVFVKSKSKIMKLKTQNSIAQVLGGNRSVGCFSDCNHNKVFGVVFSCLLILFVEFVFVELSKCTV